MPVLVRLYGRLHTLLGFLDSSFTLHAGSYVPTCDLINGKPYIDLFRDEKGPLDALRASTSWKSIFTREKELWAKV